jgi:DNA-binding MarR family transcriptional regulator
VVGRTDDIARYRYTVSAEATERELRLCGFALLNHYLAMHRVITEHVGLQPVELLILIAATTGNVQRAVQPGALPQALRGSEPLPPGLIVPMSRRAIARITGIPKETVRRHVDSMVKRGILVSMPRGVRAPNGLANRRAVAAILRLVEQHAACTEQLITLQAIARRPARPSR